MHCTQCGYMLEDGETTCPRCRVDLSPAARSRRVLITLALIIIAIAVAAICTYYVLSWHEMQHPTGV